MLHIAIVFLVIFDHLHELALLAGFGALMRLHHQLLRILRRVRWVQTHRRPWVVLVQKVAWQGSNDLPLITLINNINLLLLLLQRHLLLLLHRLMMIVILLMRLLFICDYIYYNFTIILIHYLLGVLVTALTSTLHCSLRRVILLFNCPLRGRLLIGACAEWLWDASGESLGEEVILAQVFFPHLKSVFKYRFGILDVPHLALAHTKIKVGY